MSEQIGLLGVEELYAKAEKLAGRPVEVDRLPNGQYVALWMCFDHSPPGTAQTEAEALEKLIGVLEARNLDHLPVLSDEDLKSLEVE